MEEVLHALPLHIQRNEIREMFRICFMFLSLKVALPAQVTFAEHPQYPLTIVTYNHQELSAEKVKGIVHAIMTAISTASIESKEVEQTNKQEEEVTTTDVLDDIDNAQIIEYEFEADVQAKLKEIPEDKIEPLEVNE